MSAWSSGTWCTKKGPREQTLLASPGSTSLHPHVKPCSRVRPPSSLSHPQSSHAASRSAAACVACSCAAPATTPAPHSPVFVGPGVDASSVPLVVEVVPFKPAPPRNIKPRRPPPKHPQTLVSHRPSTHPHSLTQTPSSRQYQLPFPLCCAGARATPRHHTLPHTLSSS
jgi:hypothetical protein